MTDSATTSVPTEIVSAPASDATSLPYPACAESCLAHATNSLPCAESDSACLCLHASIVQASVAECLNTSNSCSPDEATSAEAYYNNLCFTLGYPTSEGQSAAAGPIVTATGVPSAVSTSLPSDTLSHSSTSTAEPTTSTALPVPAIAGIAAAGAFLVVCIITLLIFLYIRRRSSPPKSDPVVTIESPDPSNPAHRLRKTVSLRQSALFDPEYAPEWTEKLSRMGTLTDSDHELDNLHSGAGVGTRKKSLPHTPTTPISPADTLTNNSFLNEKNGHSPPLPALPRAAMTSTTTNPFSSPPNSARLAKAPSITFLPSKSLFESSINSLSLPASRRISVAERSPAVTEFSDVASIYDATHRSHSRSNSHCSAVSSFSDDDRGVTRGSEFSTEAEIEVARASTLIMQRSRPTTFEAQPGEAPRYTSTISAARPTATSTSINNSTTTRSAKPTPLIISTKAANAHLTTSSSPYDANNPNMHNRASKPFSPTSALSPSSLYYPATPTGINSIHSKISFNPLAQNPSPTTITAPGPRETESGFTTPLRITFRPTSSMLGTPAPSSPVLATTATAAPTVMEMANAAPASPGRANTNRHSIAPESKYHAIPLVQRSPWSSPANMTLFPSSTISSPPPPNFPLYPSPSKPTPSPPKAAESSKPTNSTSSFTNFDFELSSPESLDDFRASFIDTLDFSFNPLQDKYSTSSSAN